MTAPPVPDADRAVRDRLFAPGQRLGWTFRDRYQFLQAFTEPAPQPQPLPEHLLHEEHEARQRHSRLVCVAGKIFGKIIVSCVLLAMMWKILDSIFHISIFYISSHTYSTIKDFGEATLSLLLVAGGLTIGISGAIIILSKRALARKTGAVVQARHQSQIAHQQETDEWHQRKKTYEQAEETRIDQLVEWGAVHTPAGFHRLDIFGGNLESWKEFLTGYGASVLPTRPVIVIDLSGEMVCLKLTSTAQAADFDVDVQILPDDLARTSLLSGLSAQHIVDAVIESMHGDNPNTAREERSLKHRILTSLCHALGNDLSFGRIGAGLRALLEEPDTSGYLTTEERNYITDELFSARYRHHAHDQLRCLESYIQPLEKLGTEYIERDPAYLTCMALASQGHNVRADLLTDLIVQWLTCRIVTHSTNIPEVIIAGADTIALQHLDRLSDACERRNIHLTFLFRHLRDTAVHFLGGGVTGFMKLSNTAEATHAADFIGRHHKFVISQITTTLGGNHTHTDTDTDGESHTQAITWSATHNWSTSSSEAEGTNWSETQTRQRVYEYTVEPTTLQHLPDHTMLLITTQPDTPPHLTPIEFHPTILNHPRASTDPHPELPETPQPITALPPPHTPTLTYHHQPLYNHPGHPQHQTR
jgi:hypothetical protein